MSIKKLSDNLFVVEDICNVYVIKSGDWALCIDFGLGKVLDHLSEIGVSGIDWILHTHHHRDQCQADYKAVALGTKIAVPYHETHFFNQAELFVNRRHIHHLYRMMTGHFTLRESVPVSARLMDFTVFNWKEYSFKILPTPGHTMGSLSIKSTIDDKDVIFIGDAMREDSTVHRLYDLQYQYHDTDGLASLYMSLSYLDREGADCLYPSHGSPIHEVSKDIKTLKDKISAWTRFYPFGDSTYLSPPDYMEVAKNLYCITNTSAHMYCLLSDDGSALVIDYGNVHGLHYFHPFMHKGGGQRFVPHSLSGLEERGLKKFEAFTPTHYHDDHMAGAPYLKREHGVEIWAFEKMVDQIENPRNELMGCSMSEPLKVDRVIRDGEVVRWKEYEFTIHYTPGHTDYHMGLFMEHDSKRIAVTGDLLFNGEFVDEEGFIKPRWNWAYLNKLDTRAHHESAKLLANFNPSVICPGHAVPFDVNERILSNFVDDTSKIDGFMRSFTGERSIKESISPHWCQALPFEQDVEVGKPFRVTVRITNPYSKTLNGKVSLAVQNGWSVHPASHKMHVHAGSIGQFIFDIAIADRKSKDLPVVPYGISLEVDGKDWGEISQGQVQFI